MKLKDMAIKDMNVKRSFYHSVILGVGFFALCAGALQTVAHAEDFQQALVSAYQRNPLLQAERARVREFDENYVQAQAAGRFTLNADASLGRTYSDVSILGLAGPTDISSTLTPRLGQLTLIQPLYQGGRVRGLKSQAKSGVLAARQGLRNTEQTVLLSAATAYLDVLRDEEEARIRRNNVSVLIRQKLAAQDRFEVGEGTRTDVAQADARLAASEIGLSQADARLAVSRAAYVRYMGHVPLALMAPPQYQLPETLLAAQSRARANNPQLVASRYNELTAQAAISVAKSAHRPTLALNGSLQSSRNSSASVPRAKSASITAQLRIPIFTGGMNRSRVRAAQHAKTRTMFETREAEQAIDETIANLWAQILASELALEASQRQVAAAAIAFEGVELEQQVGTRNTLDVLDAEQELLNAKLTVVQAERNLNVTSYQLLAAMGGFDAYSLQLPVQQYDPQHNFNSVTKSPFEGFVPEPFRNAVNAVAPLSRKVAHDASGLVGGADDSEAQNTNPFESDPAPELILLEPKIQD
ncbi:MAG: hypothetical protein COA69_13830 [Robiginitomaculum sp.]|nr:MAG: hypothetical protein COA69_13830 [Robiginitomaculum sp.]